MNSDYYLARNPLKLIVLATWILFSMTLAMDSGVADLILFKEVDLVVAAWILAGLTGLSGAVLGLRGWPRWWVLCAAAAFVIVLTNSVYLYDVFGGGDGKSLGLVVHDISKTVWHTLASGAVVVAYRELLMPLIQLLVLIYLAWIMSAARKSP